VVTDVKILETRTITKDMPNNFIYFMYLLECRYIGDTKPKRFWFIHMIGIITLGHAPFFQRFDGERLYPEHRLPNIIRKLYTVAGLRGSYSVYNDRQTEYVSYAIELDSTEPEVIKITGTLKENGLIGRVNRHLSGAVAPMDIDSSRFRQIINMLYTPMNGPYLTAIRSGLLWRALVRAIIPRRNQARTAHLKAELMAAAWHPSRMVDWCLDTEDQADIKEMGRGRY
jgi:hypothetical protein